MSTCERAAMSSSLEPAVLHGYRLLRRVGGGAGADVFEAQQLASGRHVALKRVHATLGTSSSQARFREEAAMLSSLASEHVVRLLEDHSDRGFFTMELLRGESLEDAALAPMAPGRVLTIVRQLASALDHAHARGIVHCDVEPENVLLTGSSERAIAFDPVTAPSDVGCHVSPEFDRWFARSCSRDPARRFASAGEQAEALENALGHRTVVRVDESFEPPSWICDEEETAPRRRAALRGRVDDGCRLNVSRPHHATDWSETS
jgi:hypothetical protein